MTIEAPDAAAATGESVHGEPSLAIVEAPSAAHRRIAGRGSWWRGLLRPGCWALVVLLIGLNAWWFWRDTRPGVGLDVIAKWSEQNRDREAEHALRQRLMRSPHDGAARVQLARLLAQRQDLLGCARQLHQVPFWWPEKGRWLLMEAGAFKESNRMRDAEAAWQAVVEDDPLHPVDPKYVTAATRDLLELYAVEARWDDAVKLIWRSYDRTNDASEREGFLDMRLRTELERILPAVAAGKMEVYLAADPEDWEARCGLAKAQLALNRPEEARRHLETCLQERPEDPHCWADYLDLLNTSGDLDGLRQAVARLPQPVAENPAVSMHRARLLERDRRWEEAAELYRRILQVRPLESETCYRLALVEDRLGHHEPAQAHRARWQALRAARTELKEAYQKVLDLQKTDANKPTYHAAIRHLAQVCETLGWKRDADGWAQLASPSHPE
jgi:tetratricopeptide (TPR) repeat protein